MIRGLVLKIIDIFDFFHKKKILNFLKKKISKINFFIDVGAHEGETIKLFLKNFKIEKIYAFEPSPYNFKNLKKNLEYLKKLFSTNIVIENIALSNSNDKILFKQIDESSSSTIKEINYKSKYLSKKLTFLNLAKDNFYKSFYVDQVKFSDYANKNNIKKIELLKIDTEGSEFDVLLGAGDFIKNINYIFFEHHYDDMIKKGYTFSNVNDLLKKNNFKLIFKSKMPFRKTFEYIYENLDIN